MRTLLALLLLTSTASATHPYIDVLDGEFCIGDTCQALSGSVDHEFALGDNRVWSTYRGVQVHQLWVRSEAVSMPTSGWMDVYIDDEIRYYWLVGRNGPLYIDDDEFVDAVQPFGYPTGLHRLSWSTPAGFEGKHLIAVQPAPEPSSVVMIVGLVSVALASRRFIRGR